MKRNYGIPYMGSKNRIAKKIIDFLPSGETLVDLFGGGGAITDCANESNKWEHSIYNELNELPYKCFLKALKGEYENEDRWISRQDFINLKDTDEYAACCFSFGNNFRNYMYNEKIEPYKRAYHYAIVLDDFKPLSELFDKETVDMLKKSVEGETNIKQRRLKFAHTLGKYIIDLSKEADGRKTVNHIGDLLENQERKESLDNLKKSVNVFETCVGNVLQHYEKKERLDSLKKSVNLTGTNCRNVLENTESKERLDSLKKSVNLTGTNCRNALQNQQRKERLDNLKKSVTMGRNIIGHVLNNQEQKERLDSLKKSVNLTGTNCRNALQNYQRKERLDSLKKEQVDNITFFNKDYRDVPIPKNAVIYCDIPYKNTGTYNKEAFDYESFYSWCEEKARQGYKVYISEYAMPEDRFECVKEINSTNCFAQTKKTKIIEKIFVPKL